MGLQQETDWLRQLDPEIWIVTALEAGRPYGLAATQVQRASIAPDAPRMLIGLAKAHRTTAAVLGTGLFALQLIPASRPEIAWHFGLNSAHTTDKFRATDYEQIGQTHVHVSGLLGWLDCTTETMMDIGDRVIIVAKVERGGSELQGPPLRLAALLDSGTDEQRQQLRRQMREAGTVDGQAIQRWRTHP